MPGTALDAGDTAVSKTKPPSLLLNDLRVACFSWRAGSCLFSALLHFHSLEPCLHTEKHLKECFTLTL